MSFSFKESNHSLYLSLVGEIDLNLNTKIKPQLLQELEQKVKSFKIDASLVSYIDSSGISILIMAWQLCTKKHINFVIEKVSTEVMDIIKLAHLDTLLPIEENTGPAHQAQIPPTILEQPITTTAKPLQTIDDEIIVKELSDRKQDKLSQNTQKEHKLAPISDNEIHSQANKKETTYFKPGTF